MRLARPWHYMLGGGELLLRCLDCKKEVKLPVTNEQYARWEGGVFAQNAFPQLNAGERELIMSGTCNECFDRIFKGQEG